MCTVAPAKRGPAAPVLRKVEADAPAPPHWDGEREEETESDRRLMLRRLHLDTLACDA
jgi:hypothetical protein